MLLPLNLPQLDIQVLTKQGLNFRWMYLVLYTLAMAVATFHGLVVQIAINLKSRILGLSMGW